jgi:hypothetical protein
MFLARNEVRRRTLKTVANSAAQFMQFKEITAKTYNQNQQAKQCASASAPTSHQRKILARVLHETGGHSDQQRSILRSEPI